MDDRDRLQEGGDNATGSAIMIVALKSKGLLTFSYEPFKDGFMRVDGKRIMGEYSVVGTKYCSHCKLRKATQFRHVTMFPSLPGCVRLLCDSCSRLDVPVHCSCGSTDAAELRMPYLSTIFMQDYLCRKCYQNLRQARMVLFVRIRIRERMVFGKRLMPAYLLGA